MDPACVNSFTVFPSGDEKVCTCMAAHDPLAYIAVGCGDGSVVLLTAKDLLRQRHPVRIVIPAGHAAAPVTNLRFVSRAEFGAATYLFVTSREGVVAYALPPPGSRVHDVGSGNSVSPVPVAPQCATLSEDGLLLTASGNGLFRLAPEENRGVDVVDGPFRAVASHGQ